MYRASIHVTLRPSILDPQGKTVHRALGELGYDRVEEVRMGKYVEIMIDETDREQAEQVAREACERLLANPVMENFTISLEEVDPETLQA